ncbi:hypothetical protein Moror_9317 [Moniliophthora roreri MCA 2997]|uniref:DUF6699 domain-containing protein n=1 Tax=Moniliophthora roreri (strain MCA 2997) TaxID=1381753 RepID=V2WX62_MONRO|nr:hypothetical protein Moror_9317 [Moniliophthora roreri MCA 2997]
MERRTLPITNRFLTRRCIRIHVPLLRAILVVNVQVCVLRLNISLDLPYIDLGNPKTVISVSPRSLWHYESPIPRTKHRSPKHRRSSHRGSKRGDPTQVARGKGGTPSYHVPEDSKKLSSGSMSRVNLGWDSTNFEHSYAKALVPPYLGLYDSPVNAYPYDISSSPPSNFSPTLFSPSSSSEPIFIGRKLETPTALEFSSQAPLRMHNELTRYCPLQWSVYLPPSTARSQWPYGDDGFYNEELLESPACAGAERLVIQMGHPGEPGDGTIAWMQLWGSIYVDHPRHTAYPRAEITVYDVLYAIHAFLHVRLTAQEMEMLTVEARNHIFAARSRRIFVEGSVRADGSSWMERDEWDKTPMRVDVLTSGGASEFAGLSLWPGSNSWANNGIAELLLRLE